MKDIFTMKKLGVVFVLTVFLFSSILSQSAYAIDPVKGVEIKVSTDNLDQSAQEAMNSGVNVTKTEDRYKGVATTDSEVAQKRAEVLDDYNQQIEALNQAKIAMDNYNQEKEEYDRLKEEYDAALAQYNIDKAQYDADMIDFNNAMADLEANKDQDGYMSDPKPQLLTFDEEPNATASVPDNVTTYTKEELLAEVESWGFTSGDGYNFFKGLNNEWGASMFGPKDLRIVLEKDVPVPVTYTDLENSYYNGKKISKVVYTYTLKETEPLPDKVPVILYSNPNKTIWYTDFFGKTTINFKVDFYDEDGQIISPNGALLSFASLNRGHLKKNQFPDYNLAIEKVLGFSGDYKEISGSSIKAHADGMYSDTNNAYRDEGSRFNTNEWDTDNNPNAWYGAGIGEVTSDVVSFDIASEKVGIIWFTLDSKVKAKDIPLKPVEPIEPIAPVEPVRPDTDTSYHYCLFHVKSQAEKKVLDEAENDIDNKAVSVGSVVKFKLSVSKFYAGHEEITSLSFKDILPENYDIDLPQTGAANPDYDVIYNATTRLLEFKAKASLIATINNDLTVDVTAPSPMVIGTVTEKDFTYENRFDVSINNEYSVESNTVSVFTPGDPKKDVFKPSDTDTSIDGDDVKPGDELLYKVTYVNVTDTSQEIEIKDVIPEGTEYVVDSADNSGVFDEGTKTITWTKEVAAGQIFEVTFKVKVDADRTEPVTNKATVSEGGNEVVTNTTSNPVKPTYNATHTFVSGTPGKNLPQAVLDLLPQPKVNLLDGSTVEPTQPVSTEVAVPGGKWVFKSYDSDNKTIDGADVNFEGTWEFEEAEVTKYKATHTFASGSPGRNLPQAVLDILPEPKYNLEDGSTVEPTQPISTEVAVPGGKWTFEGYDKNNATIEGADVNFRGVWTFKEEEVTEYKATHTFVSGTPGKNLPQAVLDLLPEIQNGLSDGSNVNSTEPSVKEVKVPGGKWVFKSYDTNNQTIEGADVNFEGVWVFESDIKYKATHTFVSGTPGKNLPEAVLNLLPENKKGLSDGSNVEPTQPSKTEVKVPGGKWVFKSYDSNNQTINGSDVNFEGTWVFEAELPKTGTNAGMNSLYAILFILSGLALIVFSKDRRIKYNK